MKVIAVIGSSGSGKTTTIEYLLRRLKREGFRLATMKHIHHEGFTMDTPGKDTWRHAQAGADAVMAVAKDEIAIIRKGREEGQGSLESLLGLMGKGYDFIFLEGLHMLVGRREDIPKILTASDEEDLARVLKDTSPPIIAIVGRIAARGEGGKEEEALGIPLIRLEEGGERLVELVKGARDYQGR